MEIGDDELDLETVEQFLFLKPLILGGNKNTIDSNEVVMFLDKIYPLITSFSDLIFSFRP